LITQSFIQELLDRIDIVDIVTKHLQLKKVGTNFTACCPFHDEKTPSFTVNSVKQFYHCFGCGRHGNAINFLMEHTGTNFIEVVETLASHVGMQIPPQKDARFTAASSNKISADKTQSNVSDKKEQISSDLYGRMEQAAKFYRMQLKHSELAITYLKERGVSGQTALHFEIGYAPPSWQNLAEVFADYPPHDSDHALIQAGLIIAHEGKKNYDRFRHRIMFPIRDHRKKIVGFGGRSLDDKEPKYLNSPETPLFTKGRELYNLATASPAIRKANQVVVVEGYMDVVMLTQHGIENVVATLGTATTSIHIQKLFRYTDEVIFCFDGDEAGTKAAWRALETSLPKLKDGKVIKFLFLPDKEDPDSYVRKHGTDAFEELLKNSQPLSVFLCKELSNGVNLSTSEGRTRLIQQARPLLVQINAPVFRLMLVKHIAELAGIDQNQLITLLKTGRKNQPSLPHSHANVSRPLSVTPYRRLIQILLCTPTYVNKLDVTFLELDDEQSKEKILLLTLVNFLKTLSCSAINELNLETITWQLGQTVQRGLLEKISQDIYVQNPGWDIEAEFTGAMARLHEIKRKSRITELHNRPLASLTSEEKKELRQLILS
jgi:DNA primase